VHNIANEINEMLQMNNVPDDLLAPPKYREGLEEKSCYENAAW
jgi:hypothetical protein